MRTRVVLRTDLKNTEMIYRKLGAGAAKQDKEFLMSNLEGISSKLNFKSYINEKAFINFYFLTGLNSGILHMDMPYARKFYHKEYTPKCDGGCIGSCASCALEWCEKLW